jgi:hypothetical protein
MDLSERSRAKTEGLLQELQAGRSPYALRESSQLADLRRRLCEAASWSERHFASERPDTSLRPPQLAPPVLCSNGWSTVDSVVTCRSKQVEAGPGLPLPPGRPLIYHPNAQLSDGAAQAASRGFFDVDNAPPWATWVGYFQDDTGDYGPYLLSWVPVAGIPLAQAGIDVNPEQCIRWLDHTDVKLRPIVEALLAPPR